MDVVGILDNNKLVDLPALKTKRLDRGRAIRQQPRLEVGIRPGLRNHLRTVQRTHPVVVAGNDLVDRVCRHQSLFNQQGFKRLSANRLRRIMIVVMMIVAHSATFSR